MFQILLGQTTQFTYIYILYIYTHTILTNRFIYTKLMHIKSFRSLQPAIVSATYLSRALPVKCLSRAMKIHEEIWYLYVCWQHPHFWLYPHITVSHFLVGENMFNFLLMAISYSSCTCPSWEPPTGCPWTFPVPDIFWAVIQWWCNGNLTIKNGDIYIWLMYL